jgi:hypothetical protein
MHTEAILTRLDDHRRDAMLELASACCPRIDMRAYLAPRLSRYDYAIVREAEGELLAFELMQEFQEHGDRHVYLGPLFSRRVACVPMFVEFFETLASSSPRGFHLLAEVQNPRIALVLKRLFLRTSYPRLDSFALPTEIEEVVRRFCAKIPHVGPVELPSLRGRGSETLFRSAPAYGAVVRWMRRRGVNLEGGDSQLIVVSCDGSTPSRAALKLDLERGSRALEDWRACKGAMLDAFDRDEQPIEEGA